LAKGTLEKIEIGLIVCPLSFVSREEGTNNHKNIKKFTNKKLKSYLSLLIYIFLNFGPLCLSAYKGYWTRIGDLIPSTFKLKEKKIQLLFFYFSLIFQFPFILEEKETLKNWKAFQELTNDGFGIQGII